MPAKIWCLFSVANNYDQPNNNLECFWHGKPSLHEVANAMGLNFGEIKDDETILKLVKLWQMEAKITWTDGSGYRIQEVEANKRL